MKGLRIQAKWERLRSQRGTIRRRGKSYFPRSTLVFRADTVSPPRPPCSPLPPIRARCRKSFSFFSFFPFTRTCQLRHRRRLHLASPSHRRYPVVAAINPVGATSTPQLPHQPSGRYNRRHVTPCGHANSPLHRPSHASRAHTSHPAAVALAAPSAPKKAPDKSFPFFFSFIFNGAGHPPPLTPPLPPTPASRTPPPVARKHPPPTPPRAHAGHPFALATTTTTSMPLRPAPPHRPRRPTTGVTRLCHTDRGCRRCAGLHHFRDTPIYSLSPFV